MKQLMTSKQERFLLKVMIAVLWVAVADFAQRIWRGAWQWSLEMSIFAVVGALLTFIRAHKQRKPRQHLLGLGILAMTAAFQFGPSPWIGLGLFTLMAAVLTVLRVRELRRQPSEEA